VETILPPNREHQPGAVIIGVFYAYQVKVGSCAGR
jgi:hypothetical protein